MCVTYMSVYGFACRCAFCVLLPTRLPVPRATAAAVCDNAPCLIYGCLAPGSTISDVFLCPTHTHYYTERALQLVTGCFSQSAASLFNTQLSIQLLSSLISSPASKLRYALFKNRPTAEFGPWEAGLSHFLGGESKVSTPLHSGLLILLQLVQKLRRYLRAAEQEHNGCDFHTERVDSQWVRWDKSSC